MKIFLKSFLLSLVIITTSNGMLKSLDNAYRLTKSVTLFFPSLAWNSFKYGSAFNFNIIINNENNNKIDIKLDQQGNIISIHDGKITPLVLGSIPRNQANIEQLQKKFNLKPTDNIGIYTLNRDFELNWAGLSKLINKNKTLKLFKYPTTDYSATSFIDLLRVVRDLDNRDLQNESIAYVHCKAGCARSPAAIAAYLLNVFNKANIDVTVKQIENYLKSLRPQVDMNNEQIKALNNFKNKLKEAGNLQNLINLNKIELEERDKEII